MPALLPEDVGIMYRQGVQHCIHVDPEEVAAILLVPAADGIHGLVGKGKSIHKGIQGAFHQFDERILDRILLGAAKDGMFEDMRHARAVRGRCPETDEKGLVFILAGHQYQSGPGPYMFQPVTVHRQFRNRGSLHQAVCRRNGK